MDRKDAFRATQRIPVAWRPADGLWVFDQFGGAAPYEIELPDDVRHQRALPDLQLSMDEEGETWFVAQRWFEGDVAWWELVEEIDVDSASVCFTPRAIAEGISGDDLAAAEAALRASHAPSAQLSLDRHPLVAIRLTHGDGSYPLFMALDADRREIGWVLDLV